MQVVLDGLLKRALLSIRTFPKVADWPVLVGAGALALVVEYGIGGVDGLLVWAEPDWNRLPAALLLAVFVPAIGEELVFRGAFVPDRREGATFWSAVLPSLQLFVVWHVVEALTFMRDAAPFFLRVDFLLTVVVLGVAAGWMRWRTGSIWPGVLLHWLEVAAWQTYFGGGEVARALG